MLQRQHTSGSIYIVNWVFHLNIITPDGNLTLCHQQMAVLNAKLTNMIWLKLMYNSELIVNFMRPIASSVVGTNSIEGLIILGQLTCSYFIMTNSHCQSKIPSLRPSPCQPFPFQPFSFFLPLLSSSSPLPADDVFSLLSLAQAFVAFRVPFVP